MFVFALFVLLIVVVVAVALTAACVGKSSSSEKNRSRTWFLEPDVSLSGANAVDNRKISEATLLFVLEVIFVLNSFLLCSFRSMLNVYGAINDLIRVFFSLSS